MRRHHNWYHRNTKDLETMKSCTVEKLDNQAQTVESACSVGDLGSIPGLGRSPGGGHGNPLQYSCLENPVDRGARWATVHRVTNRYNWARTQSHFIEKWPFLLSSFLFFSSTNHWNIYIKESESNYTVLSSVWMIISLWVWHAACLYLVTRSLIACVNYFIEKLHI